MPEFTIPKKIVKTLKAADWISLASRDKNGEPNAANKFLLECENNIVYLVDFVKGKTYENIRLHAQVAFPIMDLENLVDYQLSGIVEIIEVGPVYNELIQKLKEKELQFSTKRIIEGIRREKNHASFDFPNIDGAVIFKITIDDIVARGPNIHLLH